jgi:hypothetical protein
MLSAAKHLKSRPTKTLRSHPTSCLSAPAAIQPSAQGRFANRLCFAAAAWQLMHSMLANPPALMGNAKGEGELWLAVEVSYIVDQNDVMRAAARAALLRKAGLPAIPVAAGKRLTQGASALATESRVVLVQDGSLVGWDDALQDASGERPSAA